ncbi:MAG: 16S rRNA (uracil(1498)-N(3))-methyltransferase [Pseudomonadota bacterium]
MTDRGPKVRLFVEAPLAADAAVPLSREQAHYLFTVMRLTQGSRIAVFNGSDGEWLAEAAEAGRKSGVLIARERLRPQTRPRDLHLLFAPVKKARTDFIVEKACELGCAAVRPVFTRFTNAERLREDRLRAHMIEAAEQCGFLSVPRLDAPEKLEKTLDAWGSTRRLLVCDERRDAPSAAEALAPFAADRGRDLDPWAILIGPEGGFSDDEMRRLRAAPFVTRAALGPRVLRADTAAVAALTLWQSALGDWQDAR